MRSTLASAINTPMYQDSVSGSYAVFQMMFDSDGNIIDTNGADFFLDSKIKQDLISDTLNKVNRNSSKFYSSINGRKLQYICEVKAPPDRFDDEERNKSKPYNLTGPPTLYRVAVTDFSTEIKNLNNLLVLLVLLFFMLSTVIILFSKYFVKKSIRPVSDAITLQRVAVTDFSTEIKNLNNLSPMHHMS